MAVPPRRVELLLPHPDQVRGTTKSLRTSNTPRAADAGRRLLAFPAYATQRVADSAASYARDEAALFARNHEARRFGEQVGELEARVDALAARIEALGPRVTPIR